MGYLIDVAIGAAGSLLAAEIWSHAEPLARWCRDLSRLLRTARSISLASRTFRGLPVRNSPFARHSKRPPQPLLFSGEPV